MPCDTTTGGWLGAWVAARVAASPPPPPAPPETLARRLRRLRLGRGLSRRDVAAATGLNYFTVAQLEKGLVRNPGVLTMLPLCRLYGLSAERMMEGLA
jgi:DNA-binding XRE family transcriptional regulator